MFTAMDQALPGDAPITLVIKAPNQRMADQTVECMLGWTIRKLKQHLETVYPSKPKHNEQRLIYSGKLLQDHLTLKEILRQYEGTEEPTRHTVHLVCSSNSDSSLCSKSASEKKKSASPAPQIQSIPQSTAGAGPSASSSSPPPVADNTTGQPDGLRFRGAPSTTQSAGDNLYHGMNPGMYAAAAAAQQAAFMGGYPAMYGAPQTGFAAPAAGYSPEQYAWMAQQQAYTQYMMQYMQYYQSMYYPGQAFNMQAMAATPYMQQHPQLNADAGGNQQQPQQPQAAADGVARPNNNNMPRMNAQGGVMDQDDDDDLEPRDWLHYIYFVMRCLTFVGILFFYSNFTRFSVVFCGTLIVYFLQKMRGFHNHRLQLRQQQEERRRQAAARQQQQRAERNAAAQGGQNEGGNDGSNSTGRNGEQQQREAVVGGENANVPPANNDESPNNPAGGAVDGDQQQPAEEGHWFVRQLQLACMIFQTFFTSLLPTPPELLEAAN